MASASPPMCCGHRSAASTSRAACRASCCRPGMSATVVCSVRSLPSYLSEAFGGQRCRMPSQTGMCLKAADASCACLQVPAKHGGEVAHQKPAQRPASGPPQPGASIGAQDWSIITLGTFIFRLRHAQVPGSCLSAGHPSARRPRVSSKVQRAPCHPPTLPFIQDARSWFLAAGYAVVAVDVRGTGASFGRWRAPWTPEERQDSREIVEWISQQPWSNQQVGRQGRRAPSTGDSDMQSGWQPARRLL